MSPTPTVPETAPRPRRPGWLDARLLASSGALVMAILAAAAQAAPIIEVSPGRLEFPIVTLGDTATASFKLTNLGDATLSISSIDLPPGTAVSVTPPFDLGAGEQVDVTVNYAPPDTTPGERSLTIHSNDPVTPATPVPWDPDVRALAVETTAFTTGTAYPIGEAIVVQMVPFDRVRVERATLFYRSGETLFFQPIDMVPNGRVFIAIIPGASVQEGGVDFYVQAENDPFSIFDPKEGEARPLHVDVESPREFKLDVVVRNPGFIFRAGENIDFLLTLQRGTVFESGTLHYRAGGDSAYQQTDILEISFTGISASIPGTIAGPRGVEYWAEITTLTNHLVHASDKDPFRLRITIENLEEPVTHAGGHYRMVSIPLELQSGTGLSALLSDEDAFGAYDPARWRAFRWLPELGTNVEIPNDTAFAVQPGRAFWLISRGAHRVDTGPVPGVSSPGIDPFRLVFPPGWNQFGNPYAYPVSWRKTRKSPSLSEPIAFDSGLDDYSDAPVTELAPFTGYFIENTSTEPETLIIAPIAVDSARTPPPGDALTASLRLEARSAHGVDLANRVGLAADAGDERDAHDQAKPPPPPGSAVRLALAHRHGGARPALYRRDIRSSSGDGHTWEIEITSAVAEPVELTLRPERRWPPGTVLRLLDREQGSVVDLDPNAAEWRHEVLAFGARPYRMALLAGSADYVRGVDGTRPHRVVLDPASPNPAPDAVRLRFGLPRAAAARLEVFDASGRRVATLLDGTELPAGYHTLLWRPDRDGAGQASSGIYFHRLTVGGETRTVRSVLVR